jgi:glycosyltransferase involved in cell wall biosynthesis
MIVTNSLTGGGAERSMNLLANELSKLSWPVALVPINSSGPDQVVPICKLFAIQREWQGGALDFLRAVFKFNRFARIWKPDVVVLNCDLPEFFGVLLLSHTQLVAVEHFDRPWLTRIPLGRVVRTILRLRKVKWIAVSSHLKIWPGANTPHATIENLISEPNLLLKQHSGVRKSASLKRLVFIGRLAPQKRPTWILEMGDALDLPVTVYGDGSMRNELEGIAKLSSKPVDFRGQVVNPWQYLVPGDLLVVPSEYEGDGLVVVEGIQEKIPILLSDIPDFHRFGFPKANYCIDVDEFIERARRYAHQIDDLVVPELISKAVLSNRAPNKVVSKWVKFLDSIA